MKKSTKRIAAAIAILLALLMALSFALPLISGGTASSLDNKKGDLKKIQEDKKRIEQQIKNARSNKVSAIQEKTALDERIRLSEDEIEVINDLIIEYTVEIAQTQLRYEEAIREESEKEANFRERLRAMQEMGSPSYIGVLMQATNFSDLLGRMSVIEEIVENDRKIMAELRAARDKIVQEKYKLESDKDEQQEVRRRLSAAHAELLESYREMDQMIATIEAEEKAYIKMLDDAKAEEDKLNNEIKKIMEELARKNTAYIGGNMAWPVPGHNTISSRFGMRKHPVYKDNRMHTGIDISAPMNAKIVAANDGTVIIAAYNGGYGNCVTIDHGGGIATLYGHASKILVAKGQKVKKGDTIALVGSTGVSTGPHLHFEIIDNGKKVNPETWKK